MTTVDRALVVLPVDPGTDGGRSYSTSGLQLRAPRIYGAYYTPSGQRSPRTALIFMHPTSVFLDHYALEPLASAGYGALGLNSRFVNNEGVLVTEQVVLDLAAGVRFLRERGVEHVVLVGNSGGGGLMALYQSQAERPTITSTPAGDPPDLTRADLPRADAIITLAAHPGRAQVLAEYLDPSVVDERDPFGRDAALDMFEPDNGPPYSRAFIERYRAAQVARNRRLTAWVRAQLAQLEARGDPFQQDYSFVVFRTIADPRFLDLALDPSEREAGTPWGDPRGLNNAAMFIGRYSSLRSWLSQWSLDDSNMDGPRHLRCTSVPVLVVNFTADQAAFNSHAHAYRDAVPEGKGQYAEIKGANHYLTGQPRFLAQMVDIFEGWLGEQGFTR